MKKKNKKQRNLLTMMFESSQHHRNFCLHNRISPTSPTEFCRAYDAGIALTQSAVNEIGAGIVDDKVKKNLWTVWIY